MKVAINTTLRSTNVAAQIAYALAFALVLAVLVLASSVLLTSASSPAPVVRPMPTISPADYRLPSEPVDYSDSNYIGSYGG